MNMKVDLKPSWGETGLIVRRLAMSGEYAALRRIWPDVATAFAGAEALHKLMPQLTVAQKMLVGATLFEELAKQKP